MRYTVLRIEEDLDYGCEEREAPVMAVITLRAEEGEEQTLKMPDTLLYEREICEGDRVVFDEEHKLLKLSENADLK